MTWKNLVNPLAVTSRRRVVAPAVIYGLSLAVRFTSAAGEEVEIPPQPAQRALPLTSIMARDRSRLPYHDWDLRTAQPVVFRHDWLSGAPPTGCGAP